MLPQFQVYTVFNAMAQAFIYLSCFASDYIASSSVYVVNCSKKLNSWIAVLILITINQETWRSFLQFEETKHIQ
jgi:hypothetical protein